MTTEAIKLVGELEALVAFEKSYEDDLMRKAAAELRRLDALNKILAGTLRTLLENNEGLVGERSARAALAKAGEKA